MRLLKKYYTLLKWSIVIVANVFLIYSLVNYKGYDNLWAQWSRGIASGIWWLVLVLLLVPLNWLLETKKWQILVGDLESMPLKKAFRSVMGGNTTAFFTPNRVGEFPGRSIFLEEGHRLKGIALGVIGSFSQTFVILLGGIPAAIILLSIFDAKNFNAIYLSVAIFFFVLFLLLYFFLPEICKKLSSYSFLHKIKNILILLSETSRIKLLYICGMALLRYFVFCTQLYFMLRFFCVDLNVWLGIIGIATNYLFVTFTPSFAFSEGAVRASMAVLIIKVFSGNTVGIAAAGISIWLINFVIPMIVGSYFLSKTKL
jgi:hypothetical protein